MIDPRYRIPKGPEKAAKETEKAADARREMPIKRKRGAFRKGNKAPGGGRPKLYG